MQTLAPVAKKRKRIRNPLELNSRDFRMFKDHSTPPSSYLQGSCALYELSSSQIKKRKNISKENLNQTTPKISLNWLVLKDVLVSIQQGRRELGICTSDMDLPTV